MDELSILEEQIRHRIKRTKNQIHESHNRVYIDTHLNRNRYVELGFE
ncbi:MAG TPA: hypothetical protein VEH06_14895 [Candidatus Bathyarchaeia archaeon]|nr:hypothetical protein [Candidatus Bathyarchaeia archaeon]